MQTIKCTQIWYYASALPEFMKLLLGDWADKLYIFIICIHIELRLWSRYICYFTVSRWNWRTIFFFDAEISNIIRCIPKCHWRMRRILYGHNFLIRKKHHSKFECMHTLNNLHVCVWWRNLIQMNSTNLQYSVARQLMEKMDFFFPPNNFGRFELISPNKLAIISIINKSDFFFPPFDK